MKSKLQLNRVGQPFNATFLIITPEEKALGCHATVHRATDVHVPKTGSNPDGTPYPPITQQWTLCGKEIYYEMQITDDPVTCKRCLKSL